jgi:hypothetical protein
MSAERTHVRQRSRRAGSAGDDESDWSWTRSGSERKHDQRREESDQAERERREEEHVRNFEYEFELRALFNAEDLASKRQRRGERRALHRPMVVRQWARAGRALVALALCVLALFGWVDKGMAIPSVVHDAATSIEGWGEQLA